MEPTHTTEESQQTTQRTLSPRYVPYYFLVYSVIAIAVAGPFLLTMSMGASEAEGAFSGVFTFFSSPLIILLAIVAALGALYGWAYLVYHFYRYEVREDEFRQEYGVLNKKYTSIPYHRIQNVDLNRNLLERILGLSEIQIHTAGESSVSSEGRLPGLEPDTAEALRERLLDTARRTQAGDGV